MTLFLAPHARSAGNVALVDPVEGEISQDALGALRDDWRESYVRLAGEIGGRPLVEIEIEPHASMIAAYLGALDAGVSVLLSAPGSADGNCKIREEYRPNAVVRLENGAAVLTPGSDEPAEIHEDLRLLLSTSGTTGDPKLVRLSGDALEANAASIVAYMGLTPADVGITSLPLHYSFGLSILHSHLLAGARLVLTGASVSEQGFAEDFARHGVTNLQCVPHQVDLLDAQGFDFVANGKFRLLAQAGGRLGKSKVLDLARRGARQGWSFMVMYGQTEAAPRMAFLPPALAAQNPDAIGVPVPGGRFEIVGADGNPIKEPGRAGALRYSGPNVMMGYAHCREELALGHGDGTLETGDIAEWTASGLVRIVGREKRFVKLFGLRISLDQVEARVHEAGFEGHAVSVRDKLVFLTTNRNHVEKIQALVGDTYDLPLHDVTVSAVPRVPVLASGKTDYKALFSEAQKVLANTAGAREMSSVRGILSGALRRRDIRGEDSFSSLGGDSLAYLHVQMALEKRLGALPECWEDLPVAALERLRPDSKARWQPVEAQTLLRILAISCVVLFHANHWPLMGGTSALILLFGYSLAKFQRTTLAEGKALRLACTLLVPILPLYFVLIGGYDLVRGGVPPSMFLLVDNYHKGVQVPLVEPYWFVSLYAQLVGLVLLVALLPPLRGALGRAPFEIGVAILLLSALSTPLIEQAVVASSGLPLPWRSASNFVPILLLGWVAYFAQTRVQGYIVLLCLWVVLAIFPIPNLAYLLLLGAGSVALMFGARLPLPRFAARLAQLLASATFFVFLVHNLVIHVLKHATPVHGALGPWLGGFTILAVSFGLALVADLAWRWFTQTAGRIAAREAGGARQTGQAVPAE